MNKVKAAPYVTQNAPMNVHEGTEYSQDPQVHKPATTNPTYKPEGSDLDNFKSAVDIERNPKPTTPDEHDLSEPLQYVVSAPDAIEKIEGLLCKIEEAWPALKPLVEEVRKKVNEMEAKVWGEEYEAHEAAEGEAPSVSKPESTSRFASGDKVTVELESETYKGVLTDKNEDGSWEVMTENQVVLHRVPESELTSGDGESMVLPAALKITRMLALRSSMKQLMSAVEAAERGSGPGYYTSLSQMSPQHFHKVMRYRIEDQFRIQFDKLGLNDQVELNKIINSYREARSPQDRAKVEDNLRTAVDKIKRGEPAAPAGPPGPGGNVSSALKVEASVFDEMEEIDLGDGYVARRKKSKKKSEKKEEKPKGEKAETKEEKPKEIEEPKEIAEPVEASAKKATLEAAPKKEDKGGEDFETKAKRLLAESLDVDAAELSEAKVTFPYTEYPNRSVAAFTLGSQEYTVFNEDDADDFAKAMVMNDLKSEGLELFNQDFVRGHLDRDALDEYMEQVHAEWLESDADNLSYRDKERWLEKNDLLPEDDEDADVEKIFNEHRDTWVDNQVRERLGNDNGEDFWISNFGEKEFWEEVMKNNLIDEESLVDEAVSVDGPGHFLSAYDGELTEIGEGLVYARWN